MVLHKQGIQSVRLHSMEHLHALCTCDCIFKTQSCMSFEQTATSL